MWWQGTMRRFSWQQCKSNQRMAQYRAMGERNNNFSPSKEGSNWWNLVLIKILIAVGHHPSRAADHCIAHGYQLTCIYTYTATCWSLPIEKNYPWPPTLDSWWVSITPYTRTTISSYKCLHMDTQIVESVSGRYHRCLHWIFSSADQAARYDRPVVATLLPQLVRPLTTRLAKNC